MSYRDPKVIDNKSGLLVPQAIMRGVTQITTAFDAKFAAQQKANAIEAKRLADLGFRLDENEQNALEDFGKTQLKGSEAYQKSVRDAQEHFNEMYYDAKRSVYTNTSLTRKETAKLREEMTFAKGQLDKINHHIPRVASMSKTAKELRASGQTVIGHTKVYNADEKYSSDDFLGMGAALDNMKGTSLLMSYDSSGNLFLNGSYEGGSMAQSIETFNDDSFSLTKDITQVVKEATADAQKILMKGDAVDPAYFKTAGVDDNGNPTTELPSVVEEKVKIMENGEWTGDYQVTNYDKINQKGAATVLASVDSAWGKAGVLKGDPKNYITTMKNQFNIDEKTANDWRWGTEGEVEAAEKVIKAAINQQVAGTFGLLAKPKEGGGYDFVKEGKTSRENAPSKGITSARSTEMLNSYLKTFNTGSGNSMGKDELITSILKLGPNRRIRIGKGYYTPVGMEIGGGIVTVTKTGRTEGINRTPVEGDVKPYNLNDENELYNFIKATTGLLDSDATALAEKISGYQSN